MFMDSLPATVEAEDTVFSPLADKGTLPSLPQSDLILYKDDGVTRFYLCSDCC